MTVEIHGKCDPRFEPVKDIIASSIEAGDDVGVSFAVTLEGEPVVDLYAGYLDAEKSRPWQEDTIVNVYSTTKTMSFLCALVLNDRGQLDFDENVARYWPEFAQGGKENVKVWHLMDHAAGLSGLDVPVSLEDLYDWDKIVGLLAAQKPWWEPGTQTGYHAITQGFLIGEVVRRVSGKSIGRFFQDEVAMPLGADFFIGVPESEFGRIGNLIPPPNVAPASGDGAPDSISARTFANPSTLATDSWTPGWRKAEIPA
ncbi:MAG: beta-lactamase family protein, partial [Pseudomonadales bacterium]|nr:beta-lactamase family protein [Pseudomonadales bacterium]